MFVGHYSVSFLAKSIDRRLPLWVLFLAVQLLDILWAPLVLLGIEKVRIVPGAIAAERLDLYYMPYTHSLVAALLWSVIVFAGYRLWRRGSDQTMAAVLVAIAVFSHWVLDALVHRPDLPLYDNTAKVGLGLWHWPIVAFLIEAALLLGSMAFMLRGRLRANANLMVIGLGLLVLQAASLFGPPPPSVRMMAIMALSLYVGLAYLIARWERRYDGT